MKVATVGDHVAVCVDDDGPGIAPEDCARVFERLYTSRTVPGRTLGTGIGLAIVRELAPAMGGDARVGAHRRRAAPASCDVPSVAPSG